jgi:arylsulfatase A-like enzyme
MLVIFLDDVARDGFPGLDRFSREGVRFTNAFTTVPVCGPSRANFLTGRFQSSRVNGDLRDFDESDTIGTRMQAAGYATALMGRYVNGYTRAHGVPPGWDRWLVHDGVPHYFDYRMVNQDLERVTSPHYSEDFLLGELVQWLEAQRGFPAFAVWMPYTSHADTSAGLMAVPAPRHRGALDASYVPWRPPNYDLKPPGLPQWVQDLPSTNSDLHRQAALESTLAIEQAITWLQAVFPDLIIFISSDNGLAWGEHGMHQFKSCPHLQCLAIPMAVLGGPWSPGVVDELVVNEDIAATVLDLAGADTSDLDGVPLEPLLEGEAPPWRTLIPTFYGGTILGDAIPTWDGFYDIATGEIGASYASGERERYDLRTDPWMLDNLLFP